MTSPIPYFNDFKDDHLNLLKEKKSNWPRKKFYIGYSDEKRFTIYELNFIQRCLRFLNFGYRCTHSKHIYKNLALNIEELTATDYKIIKNSNFLKESLNKILNKNMGISSTSYVFSELLNTIEFIKTNNHSDQQTQPEIKNKIKLAELGKKEKADNNDDNDIQDLQNFIITNKVKKLPAKTSQSGKKAEFQPLAPLGLINYKSSRCYLDSALEVLLNLSHIRKRVFDLYHQMSADLTQKKDNLYFQGRFGVIESLVDLILRSDKMAIEKETSEADASGNQDGILKGIKRIEAMAYGEEVRKAIFKKHKIEGKGKFKHPSAIYHEFDTFDAYDVLIKEILGFENCVQMRRTFEVTQSKKIIMGPIDKVTRLPLYASNNGNLKDIVNSQLGKTQGLKDVFLNIDGVLKKNIDHTSSFNLASLPQMMAVQIARTNDYGIYNKNVEIDLPKDGIVDFSGLHTGSKDEACQYEITGYVVHYGSKSSGHYNASVKIGDSYFLCDNLYDKPYTEITKEEFYGNKQSYLLILNKLPKNPP